MARPRTLLWAHAFSGHSEVPRSKCCSDNMAKGPENSVFLGVDFLGKPYTSTNRGVGWAGGPRWVSKTNQIIGLSALNIDMGVMPEASRSLNCAERGIMKYSYLSYIYIYTVIIWFIKMIYRYIYIYARLSTCSHSQESQLLRHVWYNSATFGGAGWQTSRNFCPTNVIGHSSLLSRVAQHGAITRHHKTSTRKEWGHTHTHWNTCSKDSTIQVYTMLNLAEPLMWC